MTFQLADLHDAHGNQLQVADSMFRDFGQTLAFYGKMLTLRVNDDFLLIKQALQQPGEDRVLVIDGGGSMRCALLGDKLSALGVQNNWAGIVINGCVRDATEIGNTAIGVKALNTCPIKPAMEGNGKFGEDLQFAGTVFKDGAYLYADADGIAVADSLLV